MLTFVLSNLELSFSINCGIANFDNSGTLTKHSLHINKNI